MYKTISVLVPTRKRPRQLERLVTSWMQTVTDTSADLWFRVDADDRETIAYLDFGGYQMVVGSRLQGYRSLPVFFDELRQASSGDLLMTGNDDMVFQTVDWPHRVLEVANRYPDGLFDLSVDTYNAKNVPFAIISRKAADQLGFIHDPRLYWGDVFLRDVMGAFGRVVSVPEVRVDHDWMGHTPDQTFLEAQQGERRNWNTQYWTLHQACVDDAVRKLQPLARQGAA